MEGDIRDGKLLQELTTRTSFEAIVHLAARAGVRASVENPLLATEVNVTGTVQLLELARQKGIPRFIFASSSSVYGERSKVPFREEESLQHPQSPYAATKGAGELLCWTYHQLYGTHLTCLRFFTVYGPRQRPDMAIHRFTRLIDRGEEVPLFGGGKGRRDFTFVDDIVEGMVAALDRAGGFRIYNLGNSTTIETRQMLDLLARTLGKPALAVG